MMSASGDMWRVFCAIELAKSTRELVLRHIDTLKRAVPDASASWARDANLHLTLKFLGEIPQSSVADISKAASRAVAGVNAFSIRVEQTGVFPKEGQPRVVWIGINDLAGKLEELHASLEEQCAAEGFAKESRPFHPHLTIARLRKARHARTLAAAHKQLEFEPVEVAVFELLVMRSELNSEGANHTVVSRHSLGRQELLGEKGNTRR